MQGSGLNKKILYALTNKTLKASIEKINQEYAKERTALYQKQRRCAWADWLKSKARTGDTEALQALRSREARQALKGNVLTGNTTENKPNLGRIGQQPPPESKNSLRSLSQLGVVQLAR